MSDVLMNGREPEPQEMAALERGRRQERERARDLLAGVLAEDQEDPQPGTVNLLLPPLGPL